MDAKKPELIIPDPNCLSAASQEAKAETVGITKTNLDVTRCFALSLMAGIQIGLGALFMLFVKSDSSLPFAASQVLGGLCFSVGLICVIVAGSELFTGNNLMVMARLSGKISWGALLKNWVIVWVGNFIGSLILVAIVFMCNSAGMNSENVGKAMVSVATSKINMSWVTIFFRGILCNLLVCLAVWMGFAGKSVVDKIFTSIFPVMAFVACGFEHCVANMFFLPMGVVAYNSGFGADVANAAACMNVGGVLYNISAATLGNIVGGAIIVGCIYWIAYHKKNSEK
jgi:formate transporter